VKNSQSAKINSAIFWKNGQSAKTSSAKYYFFVPSTAKINSALFCVFCPNPQKFLPQKVPKLMNRKCFINFLKEFIFFCNLFTDASDICLLSINKHKKC